MQMKSTTVAAMQLGILFGSLKWEALEASYDELRAQIEELLQTIRNSNEPPLREIDEIKLPSTHSEFRERWGDLHKKISKALKALRGEILGSGSDVYAAPIFFAVVDGQKYLAGRALGGKHDEEKGLIEQCLDDLGVDRALLRTLDDEAAFLKVTGGGISAEDLILAATRFARRVVLAAAQVTPLVPEELSNVDP